VVRRASPQARLAGLHVTIGSRQRTNGGPSDAPVVGKIAAKDTHQTPWAHSLSAGRPSGPKDQPNAAAEDAPGMNSDVNARIRQRSVGARTSSDGQMVVIFALVLVSLIAMG